MKSKILLLTLTMLLSMTIAVKAQSQVVPRSRLQIPFGEKLPMVNPNKNIDSIIKAFKSHGALNTQQAYPAPSTLTPGNQDKPGQFAKSQNPPTNFHLTRDINSSTPGSNPNNDDPFTNPDGVEPSFVVLNNIAYFTADDGIHGAELWRSDGTLQGTYMVKDIYQGGGASSPYAMIEASGKLYFGAWTDQEGQNPWVSDGTEAGTYMLSDINNYKQYVNPIDFTKVGNLVFFTVDANNWRSAIWKTDGTPQGTMLVKDLAFFPEEPVGWITEPVSAGGLFFFTAFNNNGRELWRSDGSDVGTFMVKDIGPGQDFEYQAPFQLTEYNNKLYFSDDDGTGRKLWSSDGSSGGTLPVLNNNDVFTQNDYVSVFGNTPFTIMDNVLYFAGFTWPDGSGLYKYDAAANVGVELVKDLTLGPDIDFIVPTSITLVNHLLYFKVINSTIEWHDEIWKSDGNAAGTLPVKIYAQGNIAYAFAGSGGFFYFALNNATYGDELWKTDGTDAGTQIIKDLYPGPTGSSPTYLTDFNGKLLFSANDINSGRELWQTDGTDGGTLMVKNIFDAFTYGSEAGSWYRGISALGNGVVFNAYTPEFGGELYRSDGTAAGTVLLNDIATGQDWSFPNGFYKKGNVNYFIADNAIGTALYITNGTTGGLKRMTAYIDRGIYYVVNFTVTDNGQLFYVLGNRYSGFYELWHSDGTDAGSIVLNAFLYYDDYVVALGNVGFFVAGDYVNGYELWKSDGTVAGTKLVKDINPGFGGSYPYSLFAFKKDLYFGASDGSSVFRSFWKTDGTAKGTVKLKDITPDYFYENFADPAVPVYCISNNKLYFSATSFYNYDVELWVTDGHANGTELVKDINPYYSSNPNNLTDVNGTLYFTADDGTHGVELWSSGGKSKNTSIVKDISPDYSSTYPFNLCNVGGKLFFLTYSTYPYLLWSSDGTLNNTAPVIDPGLDNVYVIRHLTPSGNKLFFGGYTSQYGMELYEGDASGGNGVVHRVADSKTPDNENALGAMVYPNPAHGSASLQTKGGGKNTVVTIIDISGKVMWQGAFSNATKINLPVEKLVAGMYTVTVKSGSDIQVIKFIKE